MKYSGTPILMEEADTKVGGFPVLYSTEGDNGFTLCDY